jgi:AraC-like DNA-binding protein
MYQFGFQECNPFYSVGPYAPNHYIFHYVYSGRGILNSHDEKGRTMHHKVEAGQGFIILPKQVASYAADGKQPWNYYWVEFNGLKARELVLESGLTVNRPIYTAKDTKEQKKMEDALRHMIENSNASPFELIGYCYLFLSALAASSAYQKKAARSSLQNFYVHEILAYIEAHYHEEIRVEDLAAACNLDRSYVGKIFKGLMGTSLRDFLIRYRIRKACELMKSTHNTIGEISTMVGYPNMFSFSRAFKTMMGQPPSKWRAENKLR